VSGHESGILTYSQNDDSYAKLRIPKAAGPLEDAERTGQEALRNSVGLEAWF
jgi:hypothetical protein